MKQTLQNLLAEGKTKQVIDQLRQVTRPDADLHDEVLQLSARFEEMEKQNRLNLSENADIGLERNRINNALLSVVNRLEFSERVTPSHPLTKPTGTPLSETPTSLTVSVKTDRSTAATQSYQEGESIRLFVQATQPCYIRALYKLADGQTVLLAEDKQVTDKDVPSWVELGTGFEVSEPFGAEELHVFAQSAPFDDLKTIAKDGYRYIPSGMPEAVTATRRGLKPKAIHTETQLHLITKPKQI